jgi:osmoprotectant transport system permease protein
MNWADYWDYAALNLYLGVAPALIGLVIAVPVGIACARWRLLYPPILSVTNVLYALPSLALFVVLIPYTGLGDLTLIIPLSLFSLCVLVPNVVDGLRSVPDPVRQAATAMGFGPTRRLVRVELPLAIPIVIAGLRIAVVSSISLVSVGALIGVNSLGYFFIDGLQRSFNEEIWAAIIGVIVLALACDFILVVIRRLLTPWSRGRGRPGRGGGVSSASTVDAEQAVLAETVSGMAR